MTLPSDRCGAEHRAAGPDRVVGSATGLPAGRVVAIEDLLDEIEVLVTVGHEDRAINHVVAQALADLALASAADRARLVAEQTLGDGADQPPAGGAGMLLEVDLVTRWRHVGLADLQGNRHLVTVVGPPELEPLDAGPRVGGNVHQVGEVAIDGIAAELELEQVGVLRATSSSERLSRL